MKNNIALLAYFILILIGMANASIAFENVTLYKIDYCAEYNVETAVDKDIDYTNRYLSNFLPCENFTGTLREDTLSNRIDQWQYHENITMGNILDSNSRLLLCGNHRILFYCEDIEVLWDGMFLITKKQVSDKNLNSDGINSLMKELDDISDATEEVNIPLCYDRKFGFWILELKLTEDSVYLKESTENELNPLLNKLFPPGYKDNTKLGLFDSEKTYFYFERREQINVYSPRNSQTKFIVVLTTEDRSTLDRIYKTWMNQFDWVLASDRFYDNFNCPERLKQPIWTSIKEIKNENDQVENDFAQFMNSTRNNPNLESTKKINDEIISFGVDISNKRKQFQKLSEFTQALSMGVVNVSSDKRYPERHVFLPLLAFYYEDNTECYQYGDQKINEYHQSYMEKLSIVNTKYLMEHTAIQSDNSEKQIDLLKQEIDGNKKNFEIELSATIAQSVFSITVVLFSLFVTVLINIYEKVETVERKEFSYLAFSWKNRKNLIFFWLPVIAILVLGTLVIVIMTNPADIRIISNVLLILLFVAISYMCFNIIGISSKFPSLPESIENALGPLLKTLKEIKEIESKTKKSRDYASDNLRAKLEGIEGEGKTLSEISKNTKEEKNSKHVD